MDLSNGNNYMCSLFEGEFFVTTKELEDKLQAELQDGYITVEDIDHAEFWKVEPVILCVDVTQTVKITE